MNVKELTFTSDESLYNDVYFTVNFRIAGSRLKGEAQRLKKVVDSLDASAHAALNAMWEKGSVDIDDFKGLGSEYFEKHFRPKADFVVAADGDITLALDTSLDDELQAEGLVRELIRLIQVLRKDAGFAVEQRITAQISTEDDFASAAIEKYAEKIAQDILASDLTTVDAPDAVNEYEIRGAKIVVGLKADK